MIQFIKNNNVSSRKQLAEKYNVKTSTISYWLQLYSIKLSDYSNKSKKPSKQELIQFIKDNNGSSYTQLSKKYNVKISTIQSWRQSYSIQLKDFQEKTNKPSKQELIQVIKDNNGSSYKQLSEKYNVKASVINNWLHSYSIKLSDYSNKPSKQKLIQFIKNNNVSSRKQLAEKYNVKTSTISYWLQLYSIKLSDFQEKTNKPSKQELIQFIKDNNGSSYTQLADHYDVTKSCISHWLHSYSIKLSYYQEKNKPSKQELTQFIKDNNGSSYTQLSEKYNVKTSTITGWLQLYSIKLSDFQEKTNKPSKQELIQFIKNNNGSSYTQLSEKYNVKTSTITGWLRLYSIKLSDYSNKSKKPSKQELIQFIKDNNVSSYDQLSEKYNVKISTIKSWLQSYSIKLSDFQENKKPSKQELIQFIIDNNGASYNILSKQYNVKASTIHNWLQSYSIKLTDFQENKKPSKQELIQFIIDNNGSSYTQLTHHYDVTQSGISHWFKSYSIKLLDFKNETIFYHKDNFLNLSDDPHKNHISIKDLDYDKIVLLIKGENPVVYVEKEGKGKTTTPNALIEEYIRKETVE